MVWAQSSPSPGKAAQVGRDRAPPAIPRTRGLGHGDLAAAQHHARLLVPVAVGAPAGGVVAALGAGDGGDVLLEHGPEPLLPAPTAKASSPSFTVPATE